MSSRRRADRRTTDEHLSLSLSLRSERKKSHLKGQRKESRLIIIHSDADLFHRSSLVDETKLFEADLPGEDVLQEQEHSAVESEEWTHLQAPLTAAGQHPNETRPKEKDQSQETVESNTPRLTREREVRERRRERERGQTSMAIKESK